MKTSSLFVRALLTAVLLTLLVGCAKTASSSDSSEQATPNAPSSEAPAASAGGGWMDSIPASVPKFEYGTYDSDQSLEMQAGEQTIFSLYYEGVTPKDAEAYIETLKTAGFEMIADPATDGVNAAGALKDASGTTLIGLSISQQSSGHVDLTLNVMKATE